MTYSNEVYILQSFSDLRGKEKESLQGGEDGPVQRRINRKNAAVTPMIRSLGFQRVMPTRQAGERQRHQKRLPCCGLTTGVPR